MSLIVWMTVAAIAGLALGAGLLPLGLRARRIKDHPARRKPWFGRSDSTETPPDERPLYVRLLGPAFDELPPVLREFHARGGAARGVLRVERGRGVLRSWVADQLRLPRAAEAVPVVLQVARDGGAERWTRRFGETRLDTIQQSENGLLLESLGWAELLFRVSAPDGVLSFDQVGLRTCGVRWPRCLVPRTRATAAGSGHAWEVRVRVEAPGVGLLCAYGGRMEPV